MCLLLAVCIWLLYQVKHSHDKKKAFDANNAKIANREDSGDQILKFGRKDPNHGAEVTSENEKHSEEEESEEEEEGKQEENIDKERGDGDDEIDEHDQEKVDEAAERGEEFSDEDKEAREEENEEKEEENGRSEDVGFSENHEHDGEDRNTQEAREENYKGDDASSAVVRDNQMIKTEVDNEELRNSGEEHANNIEKNDLENDHKTITTKDGTVNQNDSKPNTGELPVATGDGETTVNNPSDDATNAEKGVEVTMSKLENESHSTSPSTGSLDQMAWHKDATGDTSETSGLYLKNETTTLDSTQDQNATVEVGASDRNNPNSESVGWEQPEKSNATVVVEGTQIVSLEQTEQSNATTISEESPNVVSEQTTEAEQNEKSSTSAIVEEAQTNVLEQTEKSNATTVAEESQNAISEQTAVAEEPQKLELINSEKPNTTNQVEESDDNTTSENADVAQSETTDTSSSLVIQEEKDAITDLGTLPHIESEGRNTEDVAAE